MEKEHIPYWALAVSVISLLISLASIVIQYKEELVITDGAKIYSQIDYDKKTVKCQVELLLSNTSHTPFSIISCNVRGGQQDYAYSANKELPILLSQGESIKMILDIDYPLTDEEITMLKANSDDISVMKKWFSIIFSTPKNDYSTSISMRGLIFKP